MVKLNGILKLPVTLCAYQIISLLHIDMEVNRGDTDS